MSLVIREGELRGDEYPWQVGVRTKPRKDRRELLISLSDEPEDGAYVLSITGFYNHDELGC